MQPTLEAAGCKLLAVGIGTVERANEFCEHVGFPKEILLSDPENAAYDSLGLVKGVKDTFFNEATPLAILDRFTGEGDGARGKDLLGALGRWQPWIPPKLEQGLQQGGTFVFRGDQEAFGYKDPSTGAHASLNDVIAVALDQAEAAAAAATGAKGEEATAAS